MKVHPHAVVSPRAELGRDVSIGPFCVVEPDAVLGDGCVLEARVSVKSGTILGAGNHVFEGAVLGGVPQHLRAPHELGRLIIGAGNTIRENVTVHRGLHVGADTVIGDQNLLMVGCHVAHDCHLGSNIIIANSANLAGHVVVEDRAYLSGAVGIHQFCRIGRLAMVGGHARIVKDVPPFVTIDGGSGYVVGLNLVGLKRSGLTSSDLAQLKAAYRLIFRSGLKWTEILQRLKRDFSEGVAATYNAFFAGGSRGITPERRLPTAATIRLPENPDAVEEGSEAARRVKFG
ncbi:MAG: acyl-ACP--UDP-N-acetylglucosamine O-acyltransferase [Pirellulales bacterium]